MSFPAQSLASAEKVPSRARKPGVASSALFWLGTALFSALLGFCFLGPLLYHHNGLAIHLGAIGQAPSWSYPAGTDDLGRNELTRLMLGGRLILLIGLVSAVFSTVFGALAGLAAGYLGGMADRLITWVMDVILSIPQLVPLLLVEALFRTSAWSMIVVVAITAWPIVGRPVRAHAITVREREYVKAAESLGALPRRILFRHIVPGVSSTILTTASTSVGSAVVVVATASFLGFTLPPPWPDWASMMAQSLGVIYDGYWWLLVFPGFLFVLLQLSINWVADAAREAVAEAGAEG